MPPEDPTPPAAAAARTNPSRPRAPRLPGTYAANYEGGDPSWRRGVAVLWVIFTLMALCEAVNAAWYYLSGSVGNLGPFDAVRLILEGALFLALWLGWRWLRWPLAVMNFLYGGWLVVWLFSLHATEATARAAAGEPAPGYGLASIPVLATALVYLFSAGYLAFSADVLDFLRHRREAGRGWVAVAGCAGHAGRGGGLTMASARNVFYVALAGWIRTGIGRRAISSRKALQTIAADHGSAASYESRADPSLSGDLVSRATARTCSGSSRGWARTGAAGMSAGVYPFIAGRNGQRRIISCAGEVRMDQVDFEHGNTMHVLRRREDERSSGHGKCRRVSGGRQRESAF